MIRLLLAGNRNQGDTQATQPGNDLINCRYVWKIPVKGRIAQGSFRHLHIVKPIRPARIKLSLDVDFRLKHDGFLSPQPV